MSYFGILSPTPSPEPISDAHIASLSTEEERAAARLQQQQQIEARAERQRRRHQQQREREQQQQTTAGTTVPSTPLIDPATTHLATAATAADEQAQNPPQLPPPSEQITPEQRQVLRIAAEAKEQYEQQHQLATAPPSPSVQTTAPTVRANQPSATHFSPDLIARTILLLQQYPHLMSAVAATAPPTPLPPVRTAATVTLADSLQPHLAVHNIPSSSLSTPYTRSAHVMQMEQEVLRMQREQEVQRLALARVEQREREEDQEYQRQQLQAVQRILHQSGINVSATASQPSAFAAAASQPAAAPSPVVSSSSSSSSQPADPENFSTSPSKIMEALSVDKTAAVPFFDGKQESWKT